MRVACRADVLLKAAQERRRAQLEAGLILNRVIYDSVHFVPANKDCVPGGALLFEPFAEWDTGGRFLDLCIMSGCDYLDRLPGFGLKTAHAQLRKWKTPEQLLRILQMEGKHAPAQGYAAYLAELLAARQTFRHLHRYLRHLEKDPWPSKKSIIRFWKIPND